jgi:hypothetical protein
VVEAEAPAKADPLEAARSQADQVEQDLADRLEQDLAVPVEVPAEPLAGAGAVAVRTQSSIPRMEKFPIR